MAGNRALLAIFVEAVRSCQTRVPLEASMLRRQQLIIHRVSRAQQIISTIAQVKLRANHVAAPPTRQAIVPNANARVQIVFFSSRTVLVDVPLVMLFMIRTAIRLSRGSLTGLRIVMCVPCHVVALTYVAKTAAVLKAAAIHLVHCPHAFANQVQR